MTSEKELYSPAQLAAWGFLESVRREAKRDQLMAAIELPAPAVLDLLRQQWAHGQSLGSPAALERWLDQSGLGVAELDGIVARRWRWQQWCEREFSARVASYFLARKELLDRVQYWWLWVPEEELAGELYQRLRGDECGFDSLLDQSLASVGCKVELHGPMLLEQLATDLAGLLRVSAPGQLWSPRPCASGGWQVVKLQRRWPAVLDSETRSRLLDEMGEEFLGSNRQA